jgi:hypothetical protein
MRTYADYEGKNVRRFAFKHKHHVYVFTIFSMIPVVEEPST